MEPASPPLTQSFSSIRGKFVVLGIFGVAIALASFAWWWNLRQNRRTSELWGRENIRLIRLAKQVELWELGPTDVTEGPASDAGQPLVIDGTAYEILRRRDISHARGLVHARHALTEDASYAWSPGEDPSAAKSADSWRLAVRFQEGERTGTLLIDPASHRVRLLETEREATAIPRIIAGWERLAERERASNRSS